MKVPSGAIKGYHKRPLLLVPHFVPLAVGDVALLTFYLFFSTSKGEKKLKKFNRLKLMQLLQYSSGCSFCTKVRTMKCLAKVQSIASTHALVEDECWDLQEVRFRFFLLIRPELAVFLTLAKAIFISTTQARQSRCENRCFYT